MSFIYIGGIHTRLEDGPSDLVRKTQYRDSSHRSKRDSYDLVFEHQSREIQGRSRKRERSREKERKRSRSRSRSREYKTKKERFRDYDRRY